MTSINGVPSSDLKWPAKAVRDAFISYFVDKHNHTFVPSSPVVPHDDPTLLFANAGMNQYKKIFLGIAPPNSFLSGLTRATNSQKCVRAGGKHNDLEDVGKDTYHHTFFEMLGNWSFGDYFKEHAITVAHDLLVNVYGLIPERLYATYFGGDEKQNLEPDLEARDLWLRFLPAERVLPFDCKDNFWEMGDTGPCGPCTELHYDLIGGRDVASLVNMDDPTVIEIWNLVFIQFNRERDRSLRSLPNKHVDTGMGFERLTSILQGKLSNYDTDVFTPIFDAIQKGAGCRPYQGLLGDDDKDTIDMAYRVIADHIRTLTIAITDGAMPSSDGRGYVLRRILRRAVRYARQYLKAPPMFFSKLIDAVVDTMSDAFPELRAKRDDVYDTLRHEEETFGRTLDRGIDQFGSVVSKLKAAKKAVIPGADVFFMYDTMGFPLDLTKIMAEEVGMTIDEEAYEQEMEKAKERSRLDRANRSDVDGVRLALEAEETAFLASQSIEPTDDSGKYTWGHRPSAVVKAIFGGGRGNFLQSTSEAAAGSALGVVLDSTSFYAESGGQVADVGRLMDASNSTGVFDVRDVQGFGDFILHIGFFTEVDEQHNLAVGDNVVCAVDYEYRGRVAPNHTMTHVLNLALRDVLGDHVDQKGSLVDAGKLRFDFSQKKALSADELTEVEGIINESVKKEEVVYSEVTPLAKAKSIDALRAVFGETYPDPVRVVSVGVPIEDLLADPSNKAWSGVSVELCGGTHISSTKEARDCVIVEETSLSVGVRRITAYTKEEAAEVRRKGEEIKEQVTKAEGLEDKKLPDVMPGLLNAVNEADAPAVVKLELRKRMNALTKRAGDAFKARAKQALEEGLAQAEKEVEAAKEKGVKLVVVQVPLQGDSKALSKLATRLAGLYEEGSVMAVSVDEKKKKVISCAASKTVEANVWMMETMKGFGGKGGGKADAANGTAPFDSAEQVAKLVEAGRSWGQ